MASTLDSTDERWSITPPGGSEFYLHQAGISVSTFGGSRYDVPSRRGDNITFAYRPGKVHRNKTPDSRTVTMVMWMTATDLATGEAPVSAPGGANGLRDRSLLFNNNWDALRRLVWVAGGGQVTLTRRWRLSSAFANFGSGDGDELLEASALAEMSGNMAPVMTGRDRADFVYDFTLADPFFYGVPQSLTVTANTAEQDAVNFGHDVASYAFVSASLVGPLTGPITLKNTTPNPDVTVTYSQSIPSGKCVFLDVSQFTASLYTNSGCTGSFTNVLGNVSHTGARYWMGLQPAPVAVGGVNKLSLITGSGGDTGHAVLGWRPPYV